MEALQASGKAKSIGVSNFNILQLERLVALARVPPAVNQVLRTLTSIHLTSIHIISIHLEYLHDLHSVVGVWSMQPHVALTD